MHHLFKAFALAYKGVPFFIATKPLTPSAFLAFATASVQALSFAKRFLPAALCFLLTILPVLLFMRSAFVSPLFVFVFFPVNTRNFAFFPFFAFFAFFAFAFFFLAPIVVKSKSSSWN